MSNSFSILLKTFMFGMLLLLFSNGCGREKSETEPATWAGVVFPTMNDTQKLGQTLCLAVDPIGYFLLPEYRAKVQNLVRKCGPGAVYFASDMKYWKPKLVLEFNAVKLREVVKNIQGLSRIPILFAADFESGAWFWDKNATHFSSPMALGATGTPEMAYREGKITGLEAKAQGINWIFAPSGNSIQVSDPIAFSINCFGSDSNAVSEFCARFVQGCQEAGVAACIKYFPGPERQLEGASSESFAPFKAGISAGAFSIMGNDFSPAGENGNLSRLPVKNYLEKQFGFTGPVVRKIVFSNNPNTPVSEKAAVIAESYASGNDMVILPDDVEKNTPLIDMLITQAQLGKMDMNAINASALKIMKMKDALKLEIQDRFLAPILTGIGIDEYQRTALDIVQSSITLLRNDGAILPLDFSKQYIMFLHFINAQSLSDVTFFSDKVKSVCPGAKQVTIFSKPDQRITQEVLRRSGEADVVVCTFFLIPEPGIDASRIPKEYVELIHQALRRNRNTVGVSFCSPYLINYLPELKAFLAVYSPSDFSMSTTLDVLDGKTGVAGRLPVTLSERYPAGFGLKLTAQKKR